MRLYHLIEELALFIAMLMMFFARTPTVMDTGALCDAEANPSYQPPKLSNDVCSVMAVLYHYLYTVYFLTLFLEVSFFQIEIKISFFLINQIQNSLQALNNYTTYTYVFVLKPMLPRRGLLPLALLTPLVIVIPTAIFLFQNYGIQLQI